MLTLGDVPGHTSEEHFARVDRVLVDFARQLSTPGARRFVHGCKQCTKLNVGLQIADSKCFTDVLLIIIYFCWSRRHL